MCVCVLVQDGTLCPCCAKIEQIRFDTPRSILGSSNRVASNPTSALSGVERQQAVGFHWERKRAALGEETQERFPWWGALLVCHRFTEEKHNGGCRHTVELTVGDPPGPLWGSHNLHPTSMSEYQNISQPHTIDGADSLALRLHITTAGFLPTTILPVHIQFNSVQACRKGPVELNVCGFPQISLPQLCDLTVGYELSPYLQSFTAAPFQLHSADWLFLHAVVPDGCSGKTKHCSRVLWT